MIEMENWSPEPMSDAIGKEFSRLSFLAPFFRLSVFAEDDVSFNQMILYVTQVFVQISAQSRRKILFKPKE